MTLTRIFVPFDNFRRAGGTSQPLKIVIKKNIPVSAGLGGGSANAAALLMWLNKNTPNPVSLNVLYRIALQLGADVPVCLNGKPARVRGIGEKISPLPISSEEFILLANPNKQLSTKDVFDKFRAEVKPIKRNSGISIKPKKISSWAEYGNDLERLAIELVPEIGDLFKLLESQNGVEIVGMSGSGATCFAIFKSQIDCVNAKRIITSKNMWAVSTKILTSR